MISRSTTSNALVSAGIALAATVSGGAWSAVSAIQIGGVTYPSVSAYLESEAFRAAGGRCAFEAPEIVGGETRGGSDCTASSTNPSPIYEPDGSSVYVIPVVVHIITNAQGTQGNISDQLVQSQIQVLNEDFEARTGTNGENGHNAYVRFQLATEDPGGSPTSGITRSANDTWFADSGGYYNTLAWDPTRYLNIYTNQASGALGYVPFLPQASPGNIGNPIDRVVIAWYAFGSPGPAPPYHLGRTVTHEVGHYLGLLHPFEDGCASGTEPGCYTSGDLICDTPSLETFSPSDPSCAITQSCGSEDPVDNYMNYSDDACMERFTVEQVRRARCTLQGYRADLFDTTTPTRSSSWSSLKGKFRSK